MARIARTNPQPRTSPTSRSGLSVWFDRGILSGVTIERPTATPTLASIGYELQVSETTGEIDALTCEFRKKSAPDVVRAGLEPWIVRPTDGNASRVLGSILLCDPATTYEVRIGVQDGNGLWAYRSFEATTRADAVPTAATLLSSATRYVRGDGSDDNDGSADTTGGAWATLGKAIASAPSGAVVKLGDGATDTYLTSGITTSSGGRTNALGPITLVGAVAPVLDGGGARTVTGKVYIEPRNTSSPTGSGGPNAGVWVQETLTGPGVFAAGGGSYAVWKWVGAPVADAIVGCYASARNGTGQRLANWRHIETVSGQGALDSAAKWAELMFTGTSHNYGFWTGGTSTIYVRLPGDVDPNTQWLWFAGSTEVGLSFAAAGSRAYNLVFRCGTYGLHVNGVADVIADHCEFMACYRGIYQTGAGTVRGIWQHNRFKETNLSSLTMTEPGLIAWQGVKGSMEVAGGGSYVAAGFGSKILLYCESQAIYCTGGASQETIRHSTVDGYFNGFGIPGDSVPIMTGNNSDIYDCTLTMIADDALEPEFAVINFRAWDLRYSYCVSFLSMGPLEYGPAYLFRSTAYNCGSSHVPRTGLGVGPSGKGIKFSNDSEVRCRLYLAHVTVWCDLEDAPNDVSFAGDSAGGSVRHEAFWIRNCLLRATRYLFDEVDIDGWDEDYNVYVTTDTTRGIVVDGFDYDNTSTSRNHAAYRSSTRQGKHSNILDGTRYEVNSADALTAFAALLADGAGGDLTLASGSLATAAGTVVPNVSDRAGVDYLGAAPNLGYQP